VDSAQSSTSDWRALVLPSTGRTRRRRGRNKKRSDRGVDGTSVDRGSVPAAPLVGPIMTASGWDRVTGPRRPHSRSRQGIPRKSPRSSAVAITCEEGGPSYADALKRARHRISLADLDISRTRIHRAATGAMIIEIPGERSGIKRICWPTD